MYQADVEEIKNSPDFKEESYDALINLIVDYYVNWTNISFWSVAAVYKDGIALDKSIVRAVNEVVDREIDAMKEAA